MAPRGTVKFGYVFDGCTVVDLAEGKGNWNLGRTWNNQPITVYLNTKLDENSAKTLVAKRWTEKGMNSTDPVVFGEFNTMDLEGNNITPEGNKIASYGGEFETILTADQAANYSYEMMFSENLEKQWDPAALTRQSAAPANVKLSGNTLTWDVANDGTIAWAIFQDGEFVGITEEASYTVADADAQYAVRAANKMGGLGEAATAGAAATTTVTLSEAGYATFFDSTTSYALPTSLTAYAVSAATTDALTYTELAYIPAGTAVMLKSINKRGGRYILTATYDKTAYAGANLLKGSDEATTTFADSDNYLFYKLAFGHSGTSSQDVFGWYWGAEGGTAFQIEGHRAWLAIPKASASTRGYGLENDGTTAINKVAAEGEDAVFYNLNGQRISAPSKGLYIINNKKVVIK